MRNIKMVKKQEPAFSVSQSDGDIAGIWIIPKGKATPCVSIYMDKMQGPVVGLWSNNKKHKALAAALYACDGEGAIQLLDKKGEVVTLTASDVRKLLALVNG